MAETTIIPNSKISNGTTLYISSSNETYEEAVEISNVENIAIPKQNFNTIEANLLNAKDGIKPRLLGSRNGGELTFKVNVIDDNTDGLIKLVSYYKAQTDVNFYIVYPTGIQRIIPSCKISQCDLADHSGDAIIAYDVSAVVNGLMEEKDLI